MTVDPLWLWGGFTLFVLAMMALDLGVFHRKAHVVGFKEALGWTGVWVTLASAATPAPASPPRRSAPSHSPSCKPAAAPCWSSGHRWSSSRRWKNSPKTTATSSRQMKPPGCWSATPPAGWRTSYSTRRATRKSHCLPSHSSACSCGNTTSKARISTKPAWRSST